ncbi:MAG: AraC family transcriptional regulator [Clostridiales bacterium]|jgi:AraC-like DNA-binding protein|nr:AraC family transcriptional regulator [Clostridiales bacterium]
MAGTVFERHVHQDPAFPIIFHSDSLSVRSDDFIMHWHDNPELLFFYRGSGVITLNTETVRAQAGELVVINCNTLHSIRSLTPSCSYYCLIIDRDFCEEFGFEVGDALINSPVCSPAVETCFDRIVQEMQQRGDYYKPAVKAAALEILLHLFRHELREPATSGGRDRGRLEMVRQAIGYIRQHYREELTIDDICAPTGFSKYYFCRTFREITGQTPMDYINTLRCEYARRLLAEGNSVGESAERSGFHNYSYFTKVYKRQMGVLPSKNKQEI